jgi:hypothetical protein
LVRLTGPAPEIQLFQQLTGIRGAAAGPPAGWKALTLQGRASIRPLMAAGVILPPPFF